MGIDLGGAWRAAGDFVRRHIKSKAVREAEKRRQERRQRAALRQVKRAGTVAGVSGVGAFGYAVTVAPFASAAIAAGAVAVAGIALSGLWRGRAPAFPSREELAALPVAAEDWLLDHRAQLPDGCATSIDTILRVLGDLPPHLARLEPNAASAWDARKLLGEHLPNLVQAWCSLPALTRERDAETRRRFEDSLATIAEELLRLLDEASRPDRMQIETHGRFLHAKYRDGFSDR